MKPFRHLLADARRHQGLALIIVLSMLALATIVILAFLSVADTEHKATVTYSSSQSARRMADTAVNMVISQIRSGSERQTANVPVIHATQPGAVRKYAQSGAFLAGYKLFSDRDMIYLAGGTGSDVNAAERRFVAESEPPTGWNQGNNIARYVDLNEPVIKGVSGDGGASTSVQVYFPVIDPRAGQDIDPSEGDDVPVEGFSYETNTVLNPTNDLSLPADPDSPAPIIKPGTAGKGLNDLRLAMPVQWLYVLKDGAIGYLDDNLRFMVMNDSRDGLGGAGANLSATPDDVYGIPSETNPIIGRVAFWTDDETCKVNINTASEPTYSGQPIYYHERDHRWADYPPARAEYQRFPGHPATVALSSVLFPNPLQADNRSLDTYGPRGPVSGGDLSRALQVKERLYELMPRIHTGGSVAGTRTFEADQYRTATGDSTLSDAVQIQAAIGERLYASVDELLFSQTVNGGRRVINNALVGSTTLFNRDSLERSSAFLTAHSRGSELTMFGLPRIAMWPVAESPSKRTGFDNLIEFCSRVGGADNAYIFKRAVSRTIPGSANGAAYDIRLPRNLALLNMLDQVLNQPFPSRSENAAAAASFRDKLGTDNTRQLIVSIFDYIRCTNLYDSFLVPQNRNSWPTSPINWTTLYNTRDSSEASNKTFTPGIVRDQGNANNPFADRFFPGHGQVTPAEHPTWSVGGSNIRGFGRFISVSEIGLHFICTADGKPDMYSWRIPVRNAEQQEGVPPQFHIADANEGIISDPTNANYNIDQYVEGNQAGNPAYVSGGRTALRIDERQDFDSFQIEHDFAPGFNATDAILTNIDQIHWRNPSAAGGAPAGSMKRRFYSNFPPLSQPDQAGFYGTSPLPSDPSRIDYGLYYRRHPGYDFRNWNWTLDRDTPLLATQKRIQAMLHLEFFCPSVAYTEINPDYTIVISGNDISNIEVNRRAVFSTTQDVVIKSERPLYETDGTPEIGGYASFRKLVLGRRVKAIGTMPEDGGYDTSATGQVHSGLVNLDLVSSFLTVDRDQPLEFSSGRITINIYDTHNWQSAAPVQTIQFQLRQGQAPTPDLVTQGSYQVNYVNADSSVYNHPAIQAPRWWSFSRDGCIGRFDNFGGRVDVERPEDYLRSLRGRFYRWDGVSVWTLTRAYDPRTNLQRVPGAHASIFTRDPANYQDVYLYSASQIRENPRLGVSYGPRSDVAGWPGGEDAWDRPWHTGTDVIRTVAPSHGDSRLIAAKKFVPASDWAPHRLWNDANEYMAHNFSSYTSGAEPGYDRGTSTIGTAVDTGSRGLPPAVVIGADRDPDIPRGRNSFAANPRMAHEFFQRYYDFDDTDPGGRVGPFINKVDEGNYAIGNFRLSGWTADVKWRATYFRAGGQGARFANGSGSFFTPNRMVPSPVVLGSLPSRVWDANGEGAWTNLLFRPHVQMPSSVTWRGYTAPPGGGQPAVSSESTHPGQLTPPDHYLLDLFWMPTVEPYAISESLSTAGKINMNYQMLPFTHIRRATALHAAMKGELMAALPNPDGQNSKALRNDWGPNGSSAPVFRSEADNKYWHRGIVVDRFKPLAGADRRWWELTLAERVQGTLRQFEERFNMDPSSSTLRGGLFRSASQICEVHLIPSLVPTSGGSVNVTASEVLNYANRNDAMGRFWGEHAATGDNTRERPYANLYAKLTTRSNTFRVHVRAQSIRKAVRSVAPDVFDPERDLMSGEFRGSFLLERYIDQADLVRAGSQVNYADGSNPFSKESLESYYRFRVLESKRFAP